MRSFTGYVGAISIVVVVAIVFFALMATSQVRLIFSPPQMLGALWGHYKTEYLEPGTLRTLDKQRDNVTTSEGESYTMLRAVWMSDKPTFDGSWQWLKDNMHRGDYLFAWLFGKKPDGTYGVLTAAGGATTASDADTDVALSLVFAYARWQDPAYLTSARSIMGDIWDKEVVTIAGRPYLLANDLEKSATSTTALINVSYVNPAAYHIFSVVDRTHPWEALRDTSYTIIEKTSALALDTKTSAKLPPDWVRINRTTGSLSPPDAPLTTQFGFDALRVPFRLALDYAWFADERDKKLLASFAFLQDEFLKEGGTLSATYAHDGQVVSPYESTAMYSGVLGYFLILDPQDAATIYTNKLVARFDPGKNAWGQTLSYYDDNWAWFGIALYNNLLPNLSASLPQHAFK